MSTLTVIFKNSKLIKVSLEYSGDKVMEMPIKLEVSVMQVGSSLRITIPKEVAAHLELKKGDTVQLWADNSHVILEKKK